MRKPLLREAPEYSKTVRIEKVVLWLGIGAGLIVLVLGIFGVLISA